MDERDNNDREWVAIVGVIIITTILYAILTSS